MPRLAPPDTGEPSGFRVPPDTDRRRLDTGAGTAALPAAATPVPAAADLIAGFATDIGASVVIDFGGGDRLLLAGVADTASLQLLINLV
jgi:hypothetical protein